MPIYLVFIILSGEVIIKYCKSSYKNLNIELEENIISCDNEGIVEICSKRGENLDFKDLILIASELNKKDYILSIEGNETYEGFRMEVLREIAKVFVWRVIGNDDIKPVANFKPEL